MRYSDLPLVAALRSSGGAGGGSGNSRGRNRPVTGPSPVTQDPEEIMSPFEPVCCYLDGNLDQVSSKVSVRAGVTDGLALGSLSL